MNDCECPDCDPDCDQYADPGSDMCYDCDGGDHRPDRDE